MKRAGGRRYYRPEDIRLLVGIKNFLYDDGYTIKGVQKLLRTHGPRLLVGRSEGLSLAEMDKQGQLFKDERAGDDSRSVPNRKVIQEVISELEDLRDLLDKAL
jgi:DNA-binding transcriptional MerR regulator